MSTQKPLLTPADVEVRRAELVEKFPNRGAEAIEGRLRREARIDRLKYVRTGLKGRIAETDDPQAVATLTEKLADIDASLEWWE